VNLTLLPEAVGFDVDALRTMLMKHFHWVKPIKPRILRARVKRNKKQTIRLAPSKAVKTWLKVHKPNNAKAMMKLANNYIDQVL